MPDPGPALAHLIADYFGVLVKEGLERKEALELTADYQACLLDNQREPREDA